MSKKVSWFRINGTIPLNNAKITDLGLVGVADLEQTRRILAGVFRKRPDEFLAGFTPEGVGLADMKLSGPYDALGLDGVLQVRNGRLRPQDNFPYGIENLNVDLRCEGRRVALENLRGRMARGLLTANGSAVWNNNGLESYEVRAALNDFHYHFIPDGFRLSGSLDALFHSLPDGKSEIKGALKASDISYVTEIDLKKIIVNNSVLNIPSLKNIELDDPMDAINLDLDVELTQPWSFDTNLMKFKGLPANNFKILGTLANPGLRGRMEFIPGGRITNILPAGDVIIEKGSIDFPDPSIFNPVLDIQGQIDIVPFRVHLNIQGPLDTLNMAPTSTPTLRQDEVISLLLNPAIAPTIGNSAFSGSLSSSATASGGLADTAGGLITNLFLTSIQEQFRRALGLDRVSVAWRTGISGTSETDVVIGKNLNLGERAIPVIGSYKTSGDIVTIGGQIEWRFGNLVIHIGASGSRSVRVTPSGEIRYQWSSW
jgi:autotransporter translocation and assembly factor TamB